MSYGVFASYYDRLTSNVNYRAYALRVDSILRSNGLTSGGYVFDAACGTAALCCELFSLGYKVTGADISGEMLEIAKAKRDRRFSNCEGFRLLQLDMTRLGEKNGIRADAAVCTLDSLNHLFDLNEVRKAFSSIAKIIKPKSGMFIFDMNTPYKHEKILGDNTFVYDLPEVYTVWQNSFSQKDCSVEIKLDFFVKSAGGYKRFSEQFTERAYPQKSVVKALEESGFQLVGAFDGLKNTPPGPRCERILYVARRV